MYIAAWLSHLMGIGRMSGTSSPVNNLDNQANSAVIRLRERYSATADDKETVCCFLDFQNISVQPRRTI